MANTTFNFTGSEQTWTVPNGVNTITVELYGAASGNGNSSGDYVGNNADGGYVKGDLSVTPGETLYLYVGGRGGDDDGGPGWPNGGNSTDQGGLSTGGGGGSSDIRQGGNTQSDIVGLAGGAGSGGGSEAVGDAGDGGAGGGLAGQNGGTGGGQSGGTGGGASGFNGEAAIGESDGSYARCAGGAGGGGLNGGAHGETFAYKNMDIADGGGGGGGDGYAGGLTNVSSTTGGGLSNDNGQIVISYEEAPEPPSNLSASPDHEVNINLNWDANSTSEDSYEIYRSTSSGVDQTDYLVATVNASSTSYTDSFSSNVDHYYRVRALNGSLASNFSNEIHVKVGCIKYYDGSNWIPKTIYHGSSLDIGKDIQIL